MNPVSQSLSMKNPGGFFFLADFEKSTLVLKT